MTPPSRHERAAPGGFGTEFGRELAELVQAVAGARGAVLLDREGHAIDFAHDGEAITDLDLQIAGAQVSIELLETTAFADRRGMGTPAVLVEGRTGCIMAAVVEPTDAVQLVLVLWRRANLGLAWRHFDHAQGRLAALLGGP